MILINIFQFDFVPGAILIGEITILSNEANIMLATDFKFSLKMTVIINS